MVKLSNKILLKDLGIIFGVAIVITALTLVLGWDESLAIYMYNPASEFAWNLRQFTNQPGTIISIILLAFLLIPALRLRFKGLRYVAVIWLVALIFGGGLLAQVGAKELAERPRPRETVLLGGTQEFAPAIVGANATAELKGKSFTSGHAAMGFIFAVPFFALRRKKLKLASAFLAGGLAYGCLVGYGRMVLGAHFLTDIIWAAVFVLSVGAIASRYIPENLDIKSRYSLSFLAFAAFMVIWFNKFELNLKMPLPQVASVDVTCDEVSLTKSDSAALHVQVKGYGAPTALVTLQQPEEGAVRLRDYVGIYRDMICSANISLSPNSKVKLPKNTLVNLDDMPMAVVEPEDEWDVYSR